MKVISVIEDEEVIKKILKHLGLWEAKARPPPKTKAPSLSVYIDYSDSQVLPSEDHLYIDPDYPIGERASRFVKRQQWNQMDGSSLIEGKWLTFHLGSP